jgi:hypothetical protein
VDKRMEEMPAAVNRAQLAVSSRFIEDYCVKLIKKNENSNMDCKRLIVFVNKLR